MKRVKIGGGMVQIHEVEKRGYDMLYCTNNTIKQASFANQLDNPNVLIVGQTICYT